MSLEGDKELDRQLRELAEINNKMKDIVDTEIQKVRSAAERIVHVDTGELRQSIYAEVQSNEIVITGTCWTNSRYAPFVEFGTGPKGQRDHNGISPEYTPAYKQYPWWIHEKDIDRRVAEKYHWFYIDTPEGRFYQCAGQPASPFMYPALADNVDSITEEIKDGFQRAIERRIK